MVKVCDVVTINCPLHPETEHMFDDKLISTMKRGSYIVNTARGKICDKDAIARALESGQLAGYAGDVWFPQPAPKVYTSAGSSVGSAYLLRNPDYFFLFLGSPMAFNALACYDSTHFWNYAQRSSEVCRRCSGDFGVLL